MRRFFGGVYAVFIREWRRIRRNGTYLSMLFVLPFVTFLFFALFFEKGVAENLPIAVLDEDHSKLSRTLVSMVDETPSAVVAYEIQDMNEGEQLIREGKVYAVLQIPSRFEKSIMGNGQTHVELYNSGANISVNSLLAKDIQTAVTSFTVGVELQVLQSQGLTASQAMAQAMPIRFTKHVLFNPYINYGYYVDDIHDSCVDIRRRNGTQIRHGERVARRGQWLNRCRAVRQDAAYHDCHVDSRCGDVHRHFQYHGRADERQRVHARHIYAGIHHQLSVHRHCRADDNGEYASRAVVRRRIFGIGIHLLGTYVPDDGYGSGAAMVQLSVPVHLLHEVVRRPVAARCSGRHFDARHRVYDDILDIAGTADKQIEKRVHRQ